MKILRFLPIAAVAFIAASCQGGGDYSLSDNSSQTDSLMYYLGQLDAAQYLNGATRDTTMKEASAKQAYLNGLRAGLAAFKEGDDTYNRGFMQGVQMAGQMEAFCKQNEVSINKSSYVNSLSAALTADTMPNTTLLQGEFRNVMQNIQNTKEEKDKAASRESLKSEATKAGLPELHDGLYGKVLTKNDSTALTDGVEVNVKYEFTKADGEKISIPFPDHGKIGNPRNFPELVSKAMLSLKSGETGEYMTTAHFLFGQRASQMGLEPTDIVKFKLTPSLAPVVEEKTAPEATAADKQAAPKEVKPMKEKKK